jgi:hypothetical protein
MKRLFIVFTFLSTLAAAQQWTGVLSPNRAIDWSAISVGVPGGISTNRTQCGSTIAAYSGTASTINSAIAACGANQFVLLGAGTFNLSSMITFNGKSNVTLRGSGSNSTFLVFTAVGGCWGAPADICVAGSSNRWGGNPGTIYTWTGGLSQGSTVLTFNSVSAISVNDVLVLDQLDSTSDTGNVLVCSGTNCSNEGNDPGRGGNRNQEQYVKVMAVNSSANQVTITPAIYMPNWSSSLTPQAWDLGTIGSGVVTGVGIENLSVDGTNDGGTDSDTLIEFCDAYGNWVKGIRSIEGSRNHVWGIDQAHLQVQDSYFFGTKGEAASSYGVELYTGSDSLVQNNIFQQVTAPHMNGNDTGGVWAYNFSIDDLYGVNADYVMMASWTHDAGDAMILFEGNIGVSLGLDDIHGTGAMMTAFRNRWTGVENPAVQYNQTQAFINSPGTRYTNAVGNVLGTTGYHTTYQQTTGTQGNAGQHTVYILGCCESTGSMWSGSSGDSLVGSTLMRWGNWDAANNAVRFVASENASSAPAYPGLSNPSSTLPRSFYLSTQPSWWVFPNGTASPWPGIGPDITGGNLANAGGFAFQNPAMNCYLNVMNGPPLGTGSVLTFNPDSCYSGGGGSAAPGPPTALKAVAH